MTYSINIKLIKQKRLEHKYTLQEMSEMLGLANRSLYLKRENGYQKFKANELPLLSKKLGIPLNDFFFQTLRKSQKEKNKWRISILAKLSNTLANPNNK
ncbi:helix-turn-helix domain-containing protein [Limosilactobacillus fermentum]|uniref:helix-turn-helix domain-containing protein n=1 Tax=Limosilactobacillus fermentum TaxID=1613 RepID=UPI003461AE06